MDGDGDSDGGGADGGGEEENGRERDGVEREGDGEASTLVIVTHARRRDMMPQGRQVPTPSSGSQVFDGDLYTAT